MALITRYVNPGADGTGDGTTSGLTGVNSAYDSLSAWNTAEATNLVSAGDSHIVKCAGGRDTLPVTNLTGWTAGPANTVTIEADRAQADGFNDGQLALDTNFYYLMPDAASAGVIILGEPYFILDGIQVHQFYTGSSRGGVRVSTANCIVRNCRIRGEGSGSAVGGLYANFNGVAQFENNLVFDWLYGIRVFSTGDATEHKIYNNTVWDCLTSGISTEDDTAGANYLVKNNAVFDNVADVNDPLVTATITREYNAGEDDPPTGDPNSRTFSPTLTDDMVNPQAAQGSENVFPVANGALDGTGIGSGTDSNVPLTDLLGTTRDTTNPCIGAFDLGGAAPTFQAAWASQSNGVILP